MGELIDRNRISALGGSNHPATVEYYVSTCPSLTPATLYKRHVNLHVTVLDYAHPHDSLDHFFSVYFQALGDGQIAPLPQN